MQNKNDYDKRNEHQAIWKQKSSFCVGQRTGKMEVSWLQIVVNWNYLLLMGKNTSISKEKKPETFGQNRKIAQQGGEVAGNTRKEIEAKTGKKIVSPLNAKSLKSNHTKEVEE